MTERGITAEGFGRRVEILPFVAEGIGGGNSVGWELPGEELEA